MLTDLCIYTIKQSDDLLQVAAGDGSASFKEGKRWVSANELVANARRWYDHVPIFFAPAEATGELFAWAVLDDVTLRDNTTTYTFSRLQLFDDLIEMQIIENRPLKTTLYKASNNTPLDKGFIRPYAICRTPAVLEEMLEQFAKHALGLG